MFQCFAVQIESVAGWLYQEKRRNKLANETIARSKMRKSLQAKYLQEIVRENHENKNHLERSIWFFVYIKLCPQYTVSYLSLASRFTVVGYTIVDCALTIFLFLFVTYFFSKTILYKISSSFRFGWIFHSFYILSVSSVIVLYIFVEVYVPFLT